MSPSKIHKILFIFTGSIAVYKAVTVLSRLVQRGYDVECVLTASALKFIGRSTIEGLTGKKIHSDLYDADNVMSHIHLIRDADAVLVAPATANFINKLASGLADDLASTLFLAHDFKKPFIVAPAMNTKMFQHPQTQKSLSHLREMGVTILETGSGILACGEVGYGKLLEPEIMLTEIDKILTIKSSTKNVKKISRALYTSPRILITGGGTIEPIDDVRALTNSSTGATAIQIADYFFNLGLSVTLVLNNQKDLAVPAGIETLPFSSFADLNAALKGKLSSEHFDFVIHTAAVSDFSIEKIEGLKSKGSTHKISSDNKIKLVLKPNFKIISKLSQYSKNKKLEIIGFKLTSHADEKAVQYAVKKLFGHKQVRYVVQNDTTQIDRKKGLHHFSLFQKNSNEIQPIDSRDQLINQLAYIVTSPPLGKETL